MEFGVPSKRRVATEKHPNVAVITLQPFEGENTSRKIEFNKKSYEVLGMTQGELNEVAFSFNRSNLADNSIINANGFGIESALKVAKNRILSNKSHYEEIKTRYGIKMEDELELTIVDSGKEYNGNKVFKLVTLASHTEAMKERPRTAQELVEDSNKHALADDTQPEAIELPNAPVEGVDIPTEEQRAQMDQDDISKMFTEEDETPVAETAPASKPSSTPIWDSVEDEDSLR